MDILAILSVAILSLRTLFTTFGVLPSYPDSVNCVPREPIKYSRDFLFSQRPEVTHKKNPIALCVLHTLRNLDICAVKRTKRGTRGGSKRKIDTLVTFERPNSVYENDLKVCTQNLIKINTKSNRNRTEPVSNFRVACLNTQSARNKTNQVNNLIFDKKYRHFVLNTCMD